MANQYTKTDLQFEATMKRCRDIFTKKDRDYGASWRIMRLSTLTDQIFIKAKRIRNIELGQEPMIREDGLLSEFIAIVNYGLMALIQLRLPLTVTADIDSQQAISLYNEVSTEAKNLMTAKNHDYGEAWRQMRVSSFTDIILTKLQRIRQIEDNGGVTCVSEGVDSNYMDIIIYAVFAVIKLTGDEAA